MATAARPDAPPSTIYHLTGPTGVRKILLAVLLGLVIAAAAVTAIGYALPQGHVASREATFRAAPPAVFGAISDVARYPEWRSDLTKVDLLASSPLKWREHSGSDAIAFEATEFRPPDLLQVRIADEGLPFGGTWTYELFPDGAGTRLKITERGEVYNPIFRFVSKFIIGHTSTLETYLADLQRRLTS